jgi:DNA oxidative demethylase
MLHLTNALMHDLFQLIEPLGPSREMMAEGAVLLRRAALPFGDRLLVALNEITAVSPFRRMMTPGGYTMSVAMTNCGAAGWVTDRAGYRYDPEDPETGKPWPPMPDCFLELAIEAATDAGYPEFRPDACLINRYEPGARLSLHQDKNERDLANPIVSVSLGLPATFQFGSLKRNDPVKKFVLHHGDVAVWGGASRLCYHGSSTAQGRASRNRGALAHQFDVSWRALGTGPF